MTDYKNLKLIASSSPHIRSKDNTRSIMLDVIIALLPALVMRIYVFGVRALTMVLVSVAACVFWEWAYRKLLKKPQSIGDLSAVVTGILLAFVCPPTTPVWMLIIGSFFSIVVVKQLFGGIGKNFANPALVGRIVLFLSFSKTMTAWVFPDAVSSATPLAQLAAGQKPELLTLLLGNHGGCIGETCALALLLGFFYLLCRKVITWHTPVAVLGSMALFGGILWAADPSHYMNPLFHILTGGAMLGAVFMATDYVTSPMTHKGMLLYGAGIGIITMLIRTWGSYPEGMSFAILIMNAVVPLINKYVKPKRFGVVSAKTR